MLGGQMAGGGVGVAVPEELILMHSIIEMGPGTDAKALCRFAPVFVDAVEKWREKAKLIEQGQEVPRDASSMTPGRPGAPGMPPSPAGPGQPGTDKFIKI